MEKLLYHYCSNQKAFAILSGKSVRMSDIQKSNDYRELSLFFPQIFNRLEQLFSEYPIHFKYKGKTGERAFAKMLDESYGYWRHLFSTGEFSNFVLCFNEKADSLSQWRGYADNGNGCCLGFNKRELENYCESTDGTLRLEKVEYLTDPGIARAINDAAKDILENLRGLRQWIIENMTHDDDHPDTDGLLHFNFDGMLANTFVNSLKYKSYAFHEEEEWRLFLANPPYKNPDWLADDLEEVEWKGHDRTQKAIMFIRSRIGFFVTEDDLIPYCSINFDEFGNNPISTIWVGPKNHIRPSDLELFLQSQGYIDTTAIRSKITYC